MNFVGIDVGGTKILAIRLEDDGRLGDPSPQPTRKGSADELVDQIAEVIEDLRDADTRAVGVGIPSAVDFSTGSAKSGVNVPLQGVPLRNLLTQRLGLPVFVDNDANVAALAEAHEGGRLTCPNLVMFTVGTGVGGGLVLDGRLFRGATGAGAEMGHILIGLDLSDGAPPAAPTFPQPGSLEALASGTALDRLAQAAAAAHPDGGLGRAAAGGATVSGADVVRLSQEGDAEAGELMRVLGERLGVGIASAINLFDPDEVVIGGGVATAGDLLLAPARRAAQGYVLTGVGERTTIRLARHGVRAGVYGAALLAVQEAVR
ncbi:MAG TPA: ROK family protein [Solirubrobacteraceae bacterium]|nr:ROK family protein [Solirubrobacteraceae bacterium]